MPRTLEEIVADMEVLITEEDGLRASFVAEQETIIDGAGPYLSSSEMETWSERLEAIAAEKRVLLIELNGV